MTRVLRSCCVHSLTLACDHRLHIRCAHCNKTLSLGNYAGLEGKLYWYAPLLFCKLSSSSNTKSPPPPCSKPHFKQLFKLKGNYASGFGGQTPVEEWNQQKSMRTQQQ